MLGSSVDVDVDVAVDVHILFIDKKLYRQCVWWI
jgi:hypothetical protein